MVLGSFTAVFAEGESIEEKAGALLFDLDVLKGVNEAGDLNLDGKLNRQDALVMLSRLVGAGEEAWGFPVGEDYPFTDVTDENYQSVTQWAYTNGITVGKGNGVFGYDEEITAQDYATYLMRALGYTVEAGEDYENVLVTALEKGILDDVNVVNGSLITRGVMAVLTLNALKAETADGEGTLAAKLGIELPEDEEVAPVELEVEEVVADNLKSFTVVFNQAVKSAEVEIEDVDVETELSEDKMSLVGYYVEALDQSDAVTFVINAETEEGLKVEDLEVEKVVNDVTVPVVLGARALNPKQIEVLFSEPVVLVSEVFELWNDIKIDEEALVASADNVLFENKVVFELATALEEGSHELEVAKVADFAGFVAPKVTFTVVVIEDKDAPVALGLEVVTKDKVVVTFNERLTARGEFEVDGQDGLTTNFVDGSNQTKVEITGFTSLGIGAIVEVKVRYKGQTDTMGNEVKEWLVITTKVEDDATLPTVELTKVDTGNKVTLTFSKSMLADGEYTVLDADGEVFHGPFDISSVGFKSDTDEKVIVFEGSDLGLDSVNPDDFSIKLSDMKDASIRSNPLAETKLSFKALDTEKPTVLPGYLVTEVKADDSDKDTVTIYFSEAMDKTTLETKANYLFDGASLQAVSGAGTPKAAADGKSVVIPFKNARTLVKNQSKDFTLIGLKDLAGNFMSGAMADVSELVSADLSIVKVTLVDSKTIEVEFDQPIKTASASFITLYKGANAFTGFSSAKIKGNNNEKVVFSSPKDLGTDASVYTLKVNNFKTVANIYGKNIDESIELDSDKFIVSKTMDDEVAPVLKEVKSTVSGEVKFTFSEEISLSTDWTGLGLVVKHDGDVVTTDAVYIDDVETEDSIVFVVKVKAAYIGKVLELGFPGITNEISDVATPANDMKATDWFKVTVKK